jgi:MFS family permease
LRLGHATLEQAQTLGMSILFAARGCGALLGAFMSAALGKSHTHRLRWIIVAGFLMAGSGYVGLGSIAGSLLAAVLMLLLAHAGGSACWTSSTTLLQQLTEDRFRGRVFSAETALMTMTLAASSFVAGHLMDAGVAPRTVAVGTGVVTLIPASLWLVANRADGER